MSACDCYSYNLGVGSRAPALMDTPYHLRGVVERDYIDIDFCIANVIGELWNNKVITLGCCCGHNIKGPNMVLGGEEDVNKVKRIIKKIDSRDWSLFKWVLTNVS